VDPSAPLSSPVYPGIGRRAGALAADLVIATSLQFGLLLLISILGAPGVAAIAYVAFIPIYFIAWPCTRWQATPGKHVQRLKIVTRDGARIGLVRSAVRFAASLASLLALGLGYIVAAWDRRRRTFHDFAAGTLVIDEAASAAQFAESPPLPSVLARIGATIAIAGVIAFPFWVYYYPMHGIEVREWNGQNYAEAQPVAAALQAYKARHGRYPADLAALQPDFLARKPQLARQATLAYAAEGNDRCWLAIVYWYEAAFMMPSDRVNEYDCATREWSNLDYNDMHAK
jgi:uncharacterized RDD family membrane protein YckC